MTTARVERRLAAILAADVVAYSRLMGEDEAGTLARLTAVRKELIEPLLAEHRGRVVKLMGDGVLCEFPSVVDAVACAVAIQRGMAGREVDVPEAERVRFRIGVNLGDIIVEDGDIYGDGVNLAARLEGLAEPGGVCVSGPVHEQVRNKLPLAFDDLGEQRVKNIADPVRTYRVSEGPGEAVARPRSEGAARSPPAKPSIAVLPFANLGAPEQQYFVDGIVEDIITDLSRFRTLQVIARNSSFRYRDRTVDIGQVSRELNAHYLVQGSVRQAGGRVRITTQLADATTGHELWAERFDRNLDDIFALQDEVTRKIVSTLVVRLEDEGLALARRKPPSSLRAYDCWLRGKRSMDLFTPEGIAEARDWFEKAIAADPEFARGYSGLSLAFHFEFQYPGSPVASGPDSPTFRFAQRAVSLDDTDAQPHVVLGWCLLWERRFERARAQFDRAAALNPNDADAMVLRALASGYLGEPEAGLETIRTALGLNPHHPDWYLALLAFLLFMARRHEDALAVIERAPEALPELPAWQAAACAHLGRDEEAKRHAERFVAAAEALWMGPEGSGRGDYLRWLLRVNPFRRQADLDHFIGGLRAAGLPA